MSQVNRPIEYKDRKVPYRYNVSDMEAQKIGEYLRDLRKSKGLAQEDLASLMGVSLKQVGRWERGANVPRADVLLDMLDLLQGSVEDIKESTVGYNTSAHEDVVRILEMVMELRASRESLSRLLGYCLMLKAELAENSEPPP